VARFLRPGWLVLGGALVVAGLWFGAPRVLRRMDFFRVRRVELVGLRALTAEQVLRAVAVPARANLFDDLGPIAARAGKIPGVAHADVGRRFPGTLRIVLTEVEPVALVPGRSGLVPMDAGGRPLPFDPAASAPDLPVAAAADSLVGQLLGRVREADPGLFGQVTTAARSGGDVVLMVGGRRYWFRPDASVETIRAVTAVAQDLARRGRAFRELDGRFAGQVIVRWETA
jgi:hypothetical protein